jgi:hypothetical protein
MRRFSAILVVATVLSFGGWISMAPPTVIPSPGYDARSQEQRNALTVRQSDMSVSRRVPRRRTQHVHRRID